MHNGGERAGRRAREARLRTRVVRFRLSEAEDADLTAAAARCGLAKGAFAATATLAAARDAAAPAVLDGSGWRRELLVELMRSATLVQRIGVNLNQAVARLNATGEPSDDLAVIAEYCARVIRRLDQAAEQVRGGSP